MTVPLKSHTTTSSPRATFPDLHMSSPKTYGASMSNQIWKSLADVDSDGFPVFEDAKCDIL